MSSRLLRRCAVLLSMLLVGGCAYTNPTPSAPSPEPQPQQASIPSPADTDKSLAIRVTFTEGLAYEALENFSRALDRYRTVIEQTDGDPPLGAQSRLRMARIYRDNLSNPRRAVEVYRTYLESYTADETSSYPNVQFELGQLFQQQENWEEAGATYRKLIELSPDTSLMEQAYYNLGEVHIEQGDYSGGVQIYQRLLEEFPQGNLRDGALYRIAEARLELDQDEAALDSYLRILKNHPNSDLREYALYRTVQLAHRIGNQNLAKTWGDVYLQEYEDGQYRDDIQEITPDTSASPST